MEATHYRKCFNRKPTFIVAHRLAQGRFQTVVQQTVACLYAIGSTLHQSPPMQLRQTAE